MAMKKDEGEFSKSFEDFAKGFEIEDPADEEECKVACTELSFELGLH